MANPQTGAGCVPGSAGNYDPWHDLEDPFEEAYRRVLPLRGLCNKRVSEMIDTLYDTIIHEAEKRKTRDPHDPDVSGLYVAAQEVVARFRRP